MATSTRRRAADDFNIHEDGPATEDTEMQTDAAPTEDLEVEEEDEADDPEEEDEDEEEEIQIQEPEPEPEQKQESEAEDQDDVFSEDDDMDDDMRRLQNAFPGFRHKYRLIKRIGEGMPCLVFLVCMTSVLLLTSCRHVLYRLQGSRPTIPQLHQ